MKTYIYKEQPIVIESEEIYQVRCVEKETIVGYCLNGYEEFIDCLEGAKSAARGKAVFDDVFAASNESFLIC